MKKKETIGQLNNILTTKQLSDEEQKALKKAISILESNHTKEQVVEAVKILASLLSSGSKFFET